VNCTRFGRLITVSAGWRAASNRGTMSSFAQDNAENPARSGALRHFGRFQLLRLLGKSDRSMAWQVADPRSDQELMLVLPRVQPGAGEPLERWQQGVRQAARLAHPQLAPVVESGVQDSWPYVAHDLAECSTLADRLDRSGLPGAEAAALAIQLLQGLAFAHEGGVVHHDLQPFLLLVGEDGQLRLTGLAVAAELADQDETVRRQAATETGAMRARRSAAERDVLAAGLIVHRLLAGTPALDEADVGRTIARLPPLGREFVRLPWSTAHPIAEPLRAIVNRATDRQERQRYRNARTFERALDGWLTTEGQQGMGPLALLVDRIRAAGVLPASPGGASRAARLALMDRQRTSELADVVLQDMALAFELLRTVNSAQVRGTLGSAPVLTVRRSIAMLGLEGVRRAALALRPWPGPLNETAAGDLARQIEIARRAGRLALALRPPGYDAELVFLITLMQNLGRLVVQYHFPDDAQQIRRLMQPSPASSEDGGEEPGMSEEQASFAVLGADIEAIGAAVARYWGLDDSVMTMARRLPLSTPVRSLDDDDSLLRALASCANEALDALALPAARQAAALHKVVQRYGRALGLDLRELLAALSASARSGGSAERIATATQAMPLDGPDRPDGQARDEAGADAGRGGAAPDRLEAANHRAA
jgi:eukaryotic-like serine/threonine-protein kinase